MPLERLNRAPITDETGAPIQTASTFATYLDSLGFGIYDTHHYEVVQLDGSQRKRNTAVGYQSGMPHARVVTDIAFPDRVVGVQMVGSVDQPYTSYSFRELEPRTGQYKYANAAPIEVATLTPPAPSYNIPFAMLEDRVLFWHNSDLIVGSGSATTPFWIVSFPLSPTAPQVWTYELCFPDSTELLALTACRSNVKNCIWVSRFKVSLDQTGGYPEEYRAALYNYKTKKIERWTVLPFDGYEVSSTLGWSDEFQTLVATTTSILGESPGYGGVYVMSSTESPAIITPPERVEENHLPIATMSHTNPAVFTTHGSITQWLESHLLENGDYVFITTSPVVNDDTANPPITPLGRAYPITIIDEYHFSLPIDGTQRRVFGGGGQVAHTGWTGTAPEQKTIVTGTVGQLAIGAQLEFIEAVPSDHPIVGAIATVVQVEPLEPTFAAYVDMDMSGWPPVTSRVFRLTGPDSEVSLVNVYAKADRKDAGLASVDLLGTNPVFTVDNPTWLAHLAVSDTFPVRIHQSGLGLASVYSTSLAVKVSDSKFSIPVDATLAGKEGDVIFDSGNPCHITPSFGAFPSGLGDIFEVVTAPAGMPELLGQQFTVTSVVSGSEVVINLDNSAHTGTGVAVVRLLQHDGMLRSGYASLLATTTLDGFEVRVRVTGELGAPCAGRAVSWSATAGSFVKTPTKTDRDGYAYAVYLPPNGANGDYTLTASVETP